MSGMLMTGYVYDPNVYDNNFYSNRLAFFYINSSYYFRG